MSQTRRTWHALHPSPLAIALDGSVLASVGLYDGTHDAEAAVRTAMGHGGRVFIGVELGEGAITDLKKWVDDAAFEAPSSILGPKPRRQRRRRKASRGA